MKIIYLVNELWENSCNIKEIKNNFQTLNYYLNNLDFINIFIIFVYININ